MEIHEREMPWIERVEELIQVIEGSSIGELEITEAGTEIIIRRRPDMMMVSIPVQQMSTAHPGMISVPGAGASKQTMKEDRGVPILAPLTGVYYSSPSPDAPPFVSPGDPVQLGQVVALIEAMKVFNEIQAETTGRVTSLVATNGNVVQKGDVLLRVESL